MKNIILALVETFDRHDYNDQKYYYSAAEALSDAREMAREKDPKIKEGYVQAWEIPFADEVEMPKNPENLFVDYHWNGEIVEDLTDEDEEGTNLVEILDDLHPIFCRSFDGFGQWRNSGKGRHLWDELDADGNVIGGNNE